ncbi:MAG: ral secretion pathway protein [Acidobacteriaceae bacterium]|jgi:general secretion pathway protein A|nr:ral secretion pathway protein [Acidobacteriaceae bacterium]MDX6459663.1 ral secretion pathway protein [Acidobacteriaceae bacterium]
MYKAFFHLTRNPFDLTPDPTCFVSTRRHNEALASLYYGVRWHKGFIVVTGEVGTGKTLLLRCLLRLLRASKDVAYAYLFNSRLTPTEFLQYIVSDFGLPSSGKNKGELLLELGQFLIARGAKKLTTVLIIDEAHHLSEEILEEVRLLSNLETTDEKLLQIVLVGQPELDEKLDSIGLRQLKQRIALRGQLGPLDAEETREYIERRLQIAGADSRREPIFPTETIAAVFRHSRGLPRLINSISENALMGAYARQLPAVSPEIVEEVAKEFRLDLISAPVAEIRAKDEEMSVQRAANVLLDVAATLRTAVGGPNSGTSNGVEARKK